MEYDSQRIQQQGRQIEKPEEVGIVAQEHGESETYKDATTRWKGRSKQVIEQYWLFSEINLHRKRAVFPDWSILAVRYMENKRRDNKAYYLRVRQRQLNYKMDYRRRDEVKKREANNLKKRLEKDPSLRARKNLSKRFHEIMNNIRGYETKSVQSFIGCSTEQLKKHLESQFKRGMTWDNYGTHWHVDHIMPCASFDHSIPSQARQCWHWSNLQPLGAQENMMKGDKITQPQMNLMLCVTH